MKHRKLLSLLLVLSLLPACGSNGPVSGNAESSTRQEASEAVGATEAAEPTQEPESAAPANPAVSTEIPEDDNGMFTSRDYEVGYDETECVLINLQGDSAQCEVPSVSCADGTVSITQEGVYLLSGDLEGMILVEVDDTEKVQLILDGVTIHSPTSAAIYVRQADKVFLTTAPGSENTLSNGGEFTAIDDNSIDAAIFSKGDLTLNGSGLLTVDCPAGHGVVSKDDLAITSGTYAITAASHGLSGKDSVRVSGGTFTITADKDGIHSEHADDPEQGFVYLSGGDFTITAQGDGISASSYLQAEGGDFVLTTGGGCANAASAWSSEADASLKGLKAQGDLLLNGGSFQIDAADDALHTNGNLMLTGGSYVIHSGDDGAHADANLTISGGTVDITESYEGLEAQSIDITGGEIRVVSSDDGLNASGGGDQSGMGGYAPMDSFSASTDAYLHISGGTLYVNTEGDGLDSNGSLSVSGGTVYVVGPTMSGNGSLDFDREGVLSGGVFVAAGAGQMAQNFSSAENQGVMLVSVGSQEAGSTIELTDSQGNVLLTYSPDKPYSSVILSCPEVIQGGIYTVTAGTSTTEVTMDSLVYGAGGMGGKGGHGGFAGFGG